MTIDDSEVARLTQIEKYARDLLAAMARQHGTSPFSQNVNEAREHLASALSRPPVEADRAERVLT